MRLVGTIRISVYNKIVMVLREIMATLCSGTALYANKSLLSTVVVFMKNVRLEEFL